SSRRRHTRCYRDWSSDVCSSDLDEPSVFDYAPQHQSTCGLNFNEPVNGGRTLGPAWWAGDALVCGYSRGKLFRTKLTLTAAGYRSEERRVGKECRHGRLAGSSQQ